MAHNTALSLPQITSSPALIHISGPKSTNNVEHILRKEVQTHLQKARDKAKNYLKNTN